MVLCLTPRGLNCREGYFLKERMTESHHEHLHGPANFNRPFAIGIGLNVSFVIVEAFYGWQAGSLALLADAGHNLSDVGGLL